MGKGRDSNQSKTFQTQLGQKSGIERSTEKSEAGLKAARILKEEVAPLLNPLPANLKYEGSAAVHVYYNETLEQLFLVTQTSTLNQMPEVLAMAALKDLTGRAMEQYGHKAPKMRSGF